MVTAWMWDALVVLVLLVFAILGIKKGFIRSVSKVVSGLLALIVTLLFGTQLEQWFQGTPVYTWLCERIAKWIAIEPAIGNAASQNQSAAEVAGSGGMPKIIGNLVSKQTAAVEAGVNAVLGEVYHQIAMVLFHILFFVVLWIVIKFLLKFATAILDKIAKLPILSSLNRLLGALTGILKGWLLVSTVCLLLMLFSGNATVAGWIESIPDTYVMSVCYDQNVLISVFR